MKTLSILAAVALAAIASPAQASAECRLSTAECVRIEQEELMAKSVQLRAEIRLRQTMRDYPARIAANDHAYAWRRKRLERMPPALQTEWIRLLSCENGTPGVDCR